MLRLLTGASKGYVFVMQFRQRLTGEFAPAGTIQPAEARRFLAEQNIFLHAQMRRQRQLLINHGDAAAPRVERIGRHEGLAVEFDCARIRTVRAAEDFHQRAFARAIFPDQDMHLARGDLKGNILEGARGAEAFLHAVMRRRGVVKVVESMQFIPRRDARCSGYTSSTFSNFVRLRAPCAVTAGHVFQTHPAQSRII
jgi:hypothetical protein